MFRTYRWLLCLLGVVAVFPGANAQLGISDMDLIPGVGSFESNWAMTGTGEGWTVQGASPASPVQLSLDGGAVYVGSQSQAFTINKPSGGADGSVTIVQTQSVGALDSAAYNGQPLTISYVLKTSANLTGVITRVWIEYGRNQSITGSATLKASGLQTPLASWTRFSHSFTVPGNVFWFRLMFSVSTASGPASGEVWVDDVSMKDGDPFPDIVPRSLKMFCLGSLWLPENWVFRMTHYDGGRWEPIETTSMYETVRPDGLNCKSGHVYYTTIGSTESDPADILPHSWIQANHPNWFLTNPSGELITDGVHVGIDIGNPDLQQEVVQRYIPMLRAGKFSSVIWDAFDILPVSYLNNQITSQYPTTETWQAAVVSYLQNVATPVRSEGVRVIVNMAHGATYEEPLKSWLDYFDGVLYELGFIVIGKDGVEWPYTFNSWKYKFLSTGNTPLNKRVIIASDGANDTRLRRFGMGSFLAAMSSNSYFCLSSQWGRTAWHPDLEAPIGSPVGPFTLVSGDFTTGGVLKRVFTNGLVLVNPHPTTAMNVTLPVAYTDLDGVTRGPGVVSVGAKSAMVLIGPNPSDTTLPVVALTSPSDNASVSGVVSIVGTATDASGIARVELWVDGCLSSIRYDASNPSLNQYTFAWNSSNGPHALRLRAYDAYGNVRDSSTANVSVSGSALSRLYGAVSVNDVSAYDDLRVTFEGRPPGTTNALWTMRTTLAADGSYTLDVPNGVYDVAAKAAVSVREVAQSLNLNGPVVRNFVLANGDTNNDNIVDDADITNVILDYGRQPLVLSTDLDNDGDVTDADLTIVILGYAVEGDA